MAVRSTVSDQAWSVLAPTFAALTPRGPKRRNDRAFFDGVVWILRTGAPWRDVPPMFGKWNTLYQRFRRWAKVEADALLLLDSTIIKAPSRPTRRSLRELDSEAYGHRNVQGIDFRPVNGQPYTAEHGPNHSDEVTPLVLSLIHI